ncbi:hypothetical protein [Polaribacter sp. Hel1_85]|uniref:hypothetical protein n=1 Tax=Polaribacter sp. Hel1_85 TaxID=1250005 RepID=UPI00052C24F4|nr:hypothetical protein [Polaribacter sp. Hel1_85]KGL58390.1 hypothetical protein PHEL85_3449 [Polaribacter sp. Hel1_85]
MKKTLFIFLISFSLLSVGQIDSTQVQLKTLDTVSNTKTKSNLSELDYYKLLAEQAQKDNETYISLTQWTLGISFAFLLAIIGSQVFFNYRINKKEIDFIKKDIDEKIAELKNNLTESIDTKLEKLNKDLKTDFTRLSIDLKKSNADNFKNHKEYSNLKLEVQKSSIKQEIKALEKEVEQNKGDLWKLKGVETNALSSFIRSTFLQLELNRDVQYIMNDIIEVLENLEEIDSHSYNKLNELSKKTIESNKEKTEKMISLYKDKPVYEYTNTSPFGGIGGMGIFGPSKRYIKNKK